MTDDERKAMNATGDASGHGPGKCGAKLRQGPGTCKKPAGWGTDHVGVGACRLHLGSSPSHEIAGKRELATREIRSDLERLGIPIQGDLHDHVLDLIAKSAGYVRRLQARIEAELPELFGATYHATGNATGEAKRHVLVQMYDDERDRLAKYCSEALRAGVEERQVRAAEGRLALQAATLAALVDGALADAGVTAALAALVRRAIVERLRRLEEGD